MNILREIPIYYYKSGLKTVRYVAPVTESAIMHYELMNSHYVKLSFVAARPIGLVIGDFIETQWGRFEITEKYNPTFDGITYTYEPQFEAYYRKWKNKICRYIPTSGGNETSFNLTASIAVHARVILKNLAFLGSRDKAYYFNPDYMPPATLSDVYDASSVVYSKTDFTVAFDTSVDTKKARLVSYQNASILDSINSITDTFECEWWVTENVVHFGTCKLEQNSNVELRIGENVSDVSASQSQASYATRLYAFGAEKNLPDSYKQGISEDVTKDGVVQKRLMLPTMAELETYSQTSDTAKSQVDNIKKILLQNGFELSNGFLQISGISEQQAVESVLVNEDDYPKNVIKVGKVTTYEREADNTETVDETDKITRTYYRLSELRLVDEDGNETGEVKFLKDYILKKKNLHILFQSGTLNGMDFECQFNPDNEVEYKTDSNGNILDDDGNVTTDKTKYAVNPNAQVFEVVGNEDYGRFLPDTNLHPSIGDTFVLYNWDSTKMSGNLVVNAQVDLLLDTIEYLKKSMIDPSTYTVTMLADDTYKGVFYSLGTEVRLYHNAYFPNGYRDSRVIGIETKLDIPWDGIQYTIGEKPSYSKIGELSKQISQVTLNGQSYAGGVGGGNTIYLVKQNDNTPFSDTNAMSSLRARKEFLSKSGNDTAQGIITFLKGILLGDGAHGITGEGDATLNSVTGSGWGVDKDGDGTLRSLVTDIIKSTGFTSDDLLSGMGYHMYTDADGKSHVITDYLATRIKAYFSELEIQKTSYSGGNTILSGAGNTIAYVEEVDDANGKGYKCWFLAADGEEEVENMWKVGDQALCHMAHLSTGSNMGNRYYWRLVTETGKEEKTFTNADGTSETKTMGYVVLSDADNPFSIIYEDGTTTGKQVTPDSSRAGVFQGKADSSDAPAVGDAIVALGSQVDRGRMKAVQIASVSLNGEPAPAINFFSGVNDYSMTPVFYISPDGISGKVRFVDLTITNEAGDPVQIVNFRGDWQEDFTYIKGDMVTYDGQSWLWNNADSITGTAPSEDAGWTTVARSGRDGQNGQNGQNGESPYKLEIVTTTGNVIKNGSGSTTLKAYVYQGDKQLDDVGGLNFVWELYDKDGKTRNWYGTNSGTKQGKGLDTVTLTQNDVTVKSNIICKINK